jgi:L-ascorbate metabolism protein UlaG (beta-lactamase superfamily)
MKITKFGHCCLLIEVEGKRILTDPGRFSVAQNLVKDIDLILITHEHGDHFHSESIAEILKNNQAALVVTNTSVGKILADLGIAYDVLEGSGKTEKFGVLLEAYDGKHVEIFEDYGQVQNTGYFVAEQLFYPGDAYTEPNKIVPILALPVSGPWCKAAEAISYALRVQPTKAFPVHDGLLNQFGLDIVHGLFETQLKAQSIEFVRMNNNETKDFN